MHQPISAVGTQNILVHKFTQKWENYSLGLVELELAHRLMVANINWSHNQKLVLQLFFHNNPISFILS